MFQKTPAGEDKSHAMRKALLVVAAAILAGCGAEERTDGSSPELADDLERIERESEAGIYWLGPSFEGLPLTHAEGAHPELARGLSPERAPGVPGPPPSPAPGAFFVYGECNGEGDGENYHCTGPQVQLQHWPIASPSRYPDHFSCTRMTIRGAPAAQFSGFEIYIGQSIIRIHAATQAQVRRAAAALRPLDGSAGPGEPLPPPAIDVDKALKRCALDSLDAKLEELREGAEIPLLWAGRRFEELPLFRVEGNGRLARFMYGGCKTPEVAGSCWPALTIEMTPVGDHRPASWRLVRTGAMRCDRLRIRGAEAALLPYAHELVVFTGPAAVRLQGRDLALLRRAADALRPFDGAATPEELLPPSEELRDELRRVCGT
jgi:hypothetical protein